MSELRQNILEAIGNTPIVRLNQVTRGVPGELYAKCEFMNPGGSIKDRIGFHMMEVAEREGKIKPGGTVVEATSGNTGMGLAIAAAIKGYRSVFVMPDKMSEEKRQNLRAFGARVVMTPTGVPPESPFSHYSVAERIAKETPNAYFMNQYENLSNRETHYLTTGPEIWRQTEGKIDAIVAGMGTCGTITGLGKFFKEKNPKIKIVGVDPKGSILKDLFETGKMPQSQSYKIEGIGEDKVPANLDFSVIDHIVRVEDKESMLMTRTLLTKEGVFAGTSCGAAVVGALRYMASVENPGRVLVILPDSGNRYLSKVYNDAWMMENSFLDRKTDNTIGDLIRLIHKAPKIVSAKGEDSVESVVRTMRVEGVSQIPVMRGNEIVGVVSETELLRPLFAGEIKSSDKVEKLCKGEFALVEDIEPIARLNDLFSTGKVAIVMEAGMPKFVLTKIDLISFLSLSGAV
ncbi:MAG: cystathionine beta-synthase [Proteobacteria bacterium]|nr:cystathionine beta-synthase [Pseudomonadota bacterium]